MFQQDLSVVTKFIEASKILICSDLRNKAIAFYKSAQKIVESVKQGSILETAKSLAEAFVWASIGITVLQRHDAIPIGLCELSIIPHASQEFVKMAQIFLFVNRVEKSFVASILSRYHMRRTVYRCS